jgi:hypothetical protein
MYYSQCLWGLNMMRNCHFSAWKPWPWYCWHYHFRIYSPYCLFSNLVPLVFTSRQSLLQYYIVHVRVLARYLQFVEVSTLALKTTILIPEFWTVSSKWFSVSIIKIIDRILKSIGIAFATWYSQQQTVLGSSLLMSCLISKCSCWDLIHLNFAMRQYLTIIC